MNVGPAKQPSGLGQASRGRGGWWERGIASPQGSLSCWPQAGQVRATSRPLQRLQGGTPRSELPFQPCSEFCQVPEPSMAQGPHATWASAQEHVRPLRTTVTSAGSRGPSAGQAGSHPPQMSTRCPNRSGPGRAPGPRVSSPSERSPHTRPDGSVLHFLPWSRPSCLPS